MTIKNLEAKKLLGFWTAAVLIILGAAMALALMGTDYTSRVLSDQQAAVIAVVSQKYPLAESDVARAIQDLPRGDVEAGRAILERYGLSGGPMLDRGQVFSSQLPYYFALAVLASLLLLAIFWVFLVRNYRRIREVTAYIQRIQKKDYTLDVRDNAEGDISILKNEICKVTVMLKEQAEQLKKDKGALADALYDISHQLKTPLTSMFVMTGVVMDDKTPPPVRREFMAKIRFQLERIEWLVKSLLKMARLDSGTVELAQKPVEVAELVQKACQPLLVMTDVKNQVLTVEGESCSFTGDFNWSTEALGNIVKNCIEHTPENGQVWIRYQASRLSTDIVVEDTGGGIPPEDMPHIFERFYRGRNAAPDSVGIGLAMAKSIVEKQGGMVEVENTLKGARFTLKFFKSII